MKPYILLCLITLSLVSCENDNSSKPDPSPTILADLNIVNVASLLPLSQLKAHQYAIYVNESGDEKPLKIKVEEGIRIQTFENISYKAQFVEATLKDEMTTAYLPVVRVNTSYHKIDQSVVVLNSTISTGTNDGFMPSVTLDGLGTILIGTPISALTIANKTFSNVVTNMFPPQQFSSFTKIYYSTEFGIVGFEGLNREMWALVRYE